MTNQPSSVSAEAANRWLAQDRAYLENNRVEWDAVYLRAAGLRLLAELDASARRAQALREALKAIQEGCELAATRMAKKTGVALLDAQRKGEVEAYTSTAARLRAALTGADAGEG